MRKILFFIFTIILLTSCDNHEHNFTTYKFQGETHYLECECGKIDKQTNHSYEEKYDETYHWSLCVCSSTTEKVKHQYGEGVVTVIETDLTEGEKSYKCLDCEYTKIEKTPKINGNEVDTYPSLSNADIVSYEGKIYTYGGSPDGSNRTNSIYCYDTRNGKLYKLDVKLKKDSTSHRIALIGDKVYIFGGIRSGEKLDTVLVHDLTNQTLTELDVKMPYGLNCAQIGYYEDKIYILGGLTNNGIMSDIHEFDTKTNEFTKLEVNMTEKLYKGAWCTVGKYVYLIGGISSGRISSIYRFDMETHTYEKMNAQMSAPIAQARAVYDNNGNIYIYGGTNNSGSLIKTVYKYNIALDACTLENYELPEELANVCVVNVDGAIYILGGNNDVANIILKHEGNNIVNLKESN